MKDFFNSEWGLRDKIQITLIAFLTGIILGFTFSPIKKGIYCGNNCGNTRHSAPADH